MSGTAPVECAPIACPECGEILQHVRQRRLTTFERRIVSLLVDEGLSNKEIADRVNLSEGTVKHYLRGVFAKLGVENRVHLASLWHTEIFQLGLAS